MSLRTYTPLLFVGFLLTPLFAADAAQAEEPALRQALERAADNRPQLVAALEKVPADQKRGMEFLIENMPDRDLRELQADFLLENCELAYRAWRQSPWKDKIPEDIFLNNVLPYANINERRDAWRKEFLEKFQPLVAQAKSPAEAAAILNQKVFSIVNVKYSTGRPKADQSPQESIKAGLASCSGLAVLHIDACRACGIPARFVGTPLWPDRSGNHSWVEVWDDGWHFTGAAEPTGDKLDQAWFVDRASGARRDHPLHAIYAASFQRTPLRFPLVWDRSIDYVYAVNVTDRYADKSPPLAAGQQRVGVRVLDSQTRQRRTARLTLHDADGKSVGEQESKDERFDANDHATFVVATGSTYRVEARVDDRSISAQFVATPAASLVTLTLASASKAAESPADASTPPANLKSATLEQLDAYLAKPAADRRPLGDQPFAKSPLSKPEAEEALRRLAADRATLLRAERQKEHESRVIKLGELEMPFAFRVFGEAPKSGRSLYISMHGGGGAPKGVNDQQWENQKRLYEPAEGVYVAPRAPTNTWDLWHQSHIDRFFDRLIENFILFENIDADRVYLMGYSAGGDGVYQVAPRMADRFAAASMMAGHPNESQPAGLRNLPFSLHMGGNDGAYKRNEVAKQWGEQLAKLRQADPMGYEHWVKIYEGKGHWMDREDAAAVPWMAKFTRRSFPDRIVWRQDDVTEPRFYWLAVPDDQRQAGRQVVAAVEGQTIQIESADVDKLRVLLHDRLVDLDKPVKVVAGDRVLFEGSAPRTIAALDEALRGRADAKAAYWGVVEVTLNPAPSK